MWGVHASNWRGSNSSVGGALNGLEDIRYELKMEGIKIKPFRATTGVKFAGGGKLP